MKTRDLREVQLNKYAWKKTKKNEQELPVVAMDTETANGKAFIIGFWNGEKTVIERLRRFEDYLSLLEAHQLHGKHLFYYNLTYDYQAIIKHLDDEALEELAATDQLRREEYIIESTPDKRFRITYKGRKYDHYDLAQFYGHGALDEVAKRLLQEGKEKGAFDITDLRPGQYDRDEEYRGELNRYLERDVTLTQRLAERLQATLRPFLKPKYYYSQASPAQQYYLENAKRDMQLPHPAIVQAALNAYNGGRFEVFKRGTYAHAVTYDIKSAYPYHNSLIPALDTGRWTHDQRWCEDELLGLYRVVAEGKSHISPLRHEDKHMLYYPAGKKHGWCNHAELRVMRDYGYKVAIKEAYHYHDRLPEYPYRFLEEFYKAKERVGKDSPDYMFYKLVINGFYGKTIQLNPEHYLTDSPEGAVDEAVVKGRLQYKHARYKAGMLFNPVVAQEITGNTRAQLLNAAIDVQDAVVSFATDSITTLRRPKLRLGKHMGEWGVEAQGRFTSIGSGVYFYRHQEQMKFRGFGRGYAPAEVFKEGNDKVSLRVKRNRKLKSVARSGHGFEDLNKLFDDDKQLDLNFDEKREWLDVFRTVHDIYDMQIESKARVIP